MGIKELSTKKMEEVIASLWEERRGRMPSQTLQPTSLFITVPSKDVSMDQVFDGLLDTMISSDAEMLYKWASNWGQTRVTVHSQKGLSFQFMDRLSNEAKSYDFLTTKNLIEPGEYFRSNIEKSDVKYHILLNDSPVKIEGAILQAERMLDELVWCVMVRNKSSGIADVDAYKAALMEVKEGGFDFRYISVDQILALKQEDPSFALRIYGDSLNKGTVPQIVGAVCPFDKKTIIPKINVSEVPKQRIRTTEVTNMRSSEVVNNQLPFVTLGITLAKRPHLGHMLLAGVVNATSRALGSAPICIDGNDTGPRINAAVRYGAKLLGLTTEQIVDDLMSGKIDTSTLEEWYRNRKNIDDRTIIMSSTPFLGQVVCSFV